MRSLAILFVYFAVVDAYGQGSNGVEVSTGIGTTNIGSYTISASYFHPFLFKQVYATGGITYCNSFGRYVEAGAIPAVIPTQFGGSSESLFSQTEGIFLGIQVGDYVFVHPKLSYNFYGRYSSPGWGFAGGLLLHPTRVIGIGLSISYDRVRFDRSLDTLGPAGTTSLMLLLRFKFPISGHCQQQEGQ